MVGFWDKVGSEWSNVWRPMTEGMWDAANMVVGRTGTTAPWNQGRSGPSYQTSTRGNQGPVNDSPWGPGGPWNNRPVQRPASGAQQASFTMPGGGGFGGGGFGGGSFNFTPPAFQMPSINIPAYKPPKPPKVKKLTFKQLESLIKQDPGYIESLATEKRNYDEAMSEVNAVKARQELYQTEDTRRLELDASNALRSAQGEVTAGTGGLGGEVLRARARQEAASQRAQSDMEREYADIFAQLNSQSSQLGRQYETNKATAKQNAINRYLNTRVQPTEIVY